MADVVVTRDLENHRFEAEVDGRAAGFMDYQERGETVNIPHTEVFTDFEGQGVGSALVRHALDALRAEGKTVIPSCPFVRTWIEKHPDYQDLVAEGR
ncbi:N-acetyltransferase [Brachybacterium sp. JHP9]|uniref:N-acetyltransferase n=1 Tax=Brachybacterium equifaecis TaxID=2910770 RepID=A0ABT0R4Y2_9MICO|nr:GNAT family N-acetyltransferase [Brachybacterium equifaecis]MCL6423985.1 N-acetyltransferase [Brachybacterium equifaecis]